jgi:hypothetical protein
MFLDHLKRQPVVGHDPIPVRHQVVFGHRRKALTLLFPKGIRVNSTQPLAMPRRSLLGYAD